jgi:cobalt/nickel transport system permease protein
MRHDFLDRYSRLQSPIHRLPPSLKVSTAFCLVLGAVSVPLPGIGFFAGAALALVVVAVVSNIPYPFLLRRLLLLEPLVIGIAVLSVLRPGGLPVFFGIMARSTVSLCTMILLSNTTPFADILTLLRRIRIPRMLITVLALMYRYLFVLIDEAERMGRARTSRSPGTSRLGRWRSYAALVGQLFVRSTERAERIYAAMCARGWE